MAVTGHHARLGTRLLAKLYRGRHFRRLGYMRFQGATRTDPDEPNSSIRLLPWVVDGEAMIGLPYAAQRLGHASPDLRPVRALLIRVSLGPRPSLHHLRHRKTGFVRRLHSYYGGVRLLLIVHRRLRLLTFPPRTIHP
jgi:hypothetical protein